MDVDVFISVTHSYNSTATEPYYFNIQEKMCHLHLHLYYYYVSI